MERRGSQSIENADRFFLGTFASISTIAISDRFGGNLTLGVGSDRASYLTISRGTKTPEAGEVGEVGEA
ncbi:MAG: hypothetical protein SWY16_01825 [Cyanobacteriota bacterium]|nr:hypothetical protein [Cyanobacteriota bacterium]